MATDLFKPFKSTKAKQTRILLCNAIIKSIEIADFNKKL